MHSPQPLWQAILRPLECKVEHQRWRGMHSCRCGFPGIENFARWPWQSGSPQTPFVVTPWGISFWCSYGHPDMERPLSIGFLQLFILVFQGGLGYGRLRRRISLIYVD